MKVRLTNSYLPHYFRAAQHDVGLGRDFLSVVNLLAAGIAAVAGTDDTRVPKPRPGPSPPGQPSGRCDRRYRAAGRGLNEREPHFASPRVPGGRMHRL